MRHHFIILAFLGACTAAPAPKPTPAPAAAAGVQSDTVQAKGGASVDRANLVKELDEFVGSYGRNWGEAHRFSGFVLVTHKGEAIYERGFGFADQQSRRPNTATTSFRIGSVTKQFTATAILKLEQDGKLAVTDTIGKHLPDYPAVGRDITIHQLLTHTSGIPSYTGFPEIMKNRAQPIALADLVASFSSRPLEFKPGEKFNYSNSGYIVLGAIIEAASGQDYATYMKRHIFEPAGLRDTVVGDAPDAADRALAYEVKDDQVVPAHAIDMSVPHAAGAVRSTARDLVAWHRVLAGESILSAASKDKMYRPEKDNYAYGWTLHELDGHRIISHGGGIDGFLTGYRRVMDADLVVVVWSNRSSRDVGKIAGNAVKAAFGADLPLADEPERVPFDATLVPRVAGSYQLSDAGRKQLTSVGVPSAAIDSLATIEVSGTAKGLIFKPAGQPEIALVQTGPGTFTNASGGIEASFDLPGTTDKATGFTLKQGPMAVPYQRKD